MTSFAPESQVSELEMLQAIDRACESFEDDWSGGSRPELSSYLGEFSGDIRRRALRELLWIEWDQLRRAETPPQLKTYAARFAEESEIVHEAWQADLKRLAEVCAATEPRGGRYRILKPHARGGLGQVYVARDEELGRQVALKEIQSGQAHDPIARERFLREARITGTLDHPGIVPVYSMGQNPDGTPYYAMRFVQGDSLQGAIKKFHSQQGGTSEPVVRSQSLDGTQPTMRDATPGAADSSIATDSPRESAPIRTATYSRSAYESRDFRQLLTRFIYVCNVVEFAHQRGVLHRDLKPSNIMLGKHGETLVVDWGLAAEIGSQDPAADAPASADSAPHSSPRFTTDGAALGTPAYMSPEQARGKLAELGPTSDIYSLGATLYHLLVGRSPLAAHAIDSMLERSKAGNIPPTVVVQPAVPLPLSAICAKAMSFNRADRYASAAALADDLERWLADEPIPVYAESLRARASRWARRHITLVTTGVAASLLIAIGLATMTILMAIKNHDLSLARADAESKRLGAVAAQSKAEKRLTQVERGADLLGGIFSDLNPNSAEQEGRPLQRILGDRMLRAAKQLEADVVGDPLVVAKLQNVLGYSLDVLGDSKEAVEILRKSHTTRQQLLGERHRDTLVSLNNLASTYGGVGNLTEEVRLHELCLGYRRSTLGEDHPDTLRSLNNLALAYQAMGDLAKALPMFEQCLNQRRSTLGEDHPETLSARNNLAGAYHDAGNLAQAIPMLEQVLNQRRSTLGAEHHQTLVSLSNLAMAYLGAGDPAKAIPLLEQCHTLRQSTLGGDHPDTLMSTNSLAKAYRQNGEHGKAVPLLERCLKVSQSKNGVDHPNTLDVLNSLAAALFSSGQFSQASSLFEECLAKMRTSLGNDHPRTLALMNNLGIVYLESRDPTKALALFDESAETSRGKLGEDHPSTLNALSGLANCHEAIGALDKAIPLYEQCLMRQREKLGEEHPATLTTLNNLAGAYLKVGERDRALALVEQCLSQLRKKLGEDHPHTLGALSNIGFLYKQSGKLADAITIYRQSLERRRTKLGNEHPDTLVSIRDLASAYLASKEAVKAVPLLEELMQLNQKIRGLEHRESLPVMHLLGVAYRDVKEIAKAESLLRQCLEQRQKKQPDDWTTFNTQAWLGIVLADQERFDEAEPLLLQGYEGLAARQQKIPADQQHRRMNEAIQHIVDLYEAWGKPEEAAKWKARLTPADKKE